MKQYLYLLCFLITVIYPVKSFAEIITLNQTNIWRSMVNTKNHEMAIIGHEYNLTVALFIIPNRLSVLKIIIPKQNTQTHIQFKISHIKLTLQKSLSNNNDHNMTFYYVFQQNELKEFIHEFTQEQNANITINNHSISLYLKGTSPSIAVLLNYIHIHNIHPLPAPFNIDQAITPPKHENNNSITSIPKSHSISDYFSLNITSIFCLFLTLIILLPIFKKFSLYRRKKYALSLCQHEIQKQALQLQLRREQLLYKDAYGSIVQDKWIHEVNKFMKNRIEPLLTQHNLINYYPELRKKIRTIIHKSALKRSKYNKYNNQSHSISLVYHPKMSPLDYEEYCAQLLRDIGWQASTTNASGDQGADVIAYKKNITLILQCKLYSKPVGNKAVQEVNAAKTFYKANFAAVVSNVSYTNSARQIASSTDITLLHHEELQEYAKTFV